MNMRGRPDLAMNRIDISFPDPETTAPHIAGENPMFHFSVRTHDVSYHEVLLTSGVVREDGTIVSDDDRQYDYYEDAKIPDYFSPSEYFHPVIHQRLAKQAVAMALFDYDPIYPGDYTEEERKALDAYMRDCRD